jgi:PPK2 family polyphosphate:nucleotide phosphotransferase
MKEPDLERLYRVGGPELRLAAIDPGETAGLDREGSQRLRERDLERCRVLQMRLYAEQRRSLLLVLQGLDASGKDGVISHVVSGLNPQGARVTSFRRPSAPELAHDWLWRCVVALPERGAVGIFNRSHYEEVVTVRVHPEHLAAEGIDPAAAGDERFWRDRHATIAAWERHLVACGTRVVKVLLHISRQEQRERLIARATDPEKRWKFSAEDVAERAHWDAYLAAYEDAVRATSTEAAPWYVVPADQKWFARTAVARILVSHLQEMGPRPPEPDDDERRAADEALRALLAEAPPRGARR